MRVPSEAGANKLDNPTWIKPNQQSRTEPRTHSNVTSYVKPR